MLDLASPPHYDKYFGLLWGASKLIHGQLKKDNFQQPWIRNINSSTAGAGRGVSISFEILGGRV